MNWEIIWAHGITDLVDTRPTVWVPIYIFWMSLFACKITSLQTLLWVSALHFNSDIDIGVFWWGLLLCMLINATFVWPHLAKHGIYLGMSLHTINHFQRKLSLVRILITGAFAYLLQITTSFILQMPAEIVEGIIVSHCLTQYLADKDGV